MECNHIVASVGCRFIELADVAEQYQEWSAKVDYFNLKNKTEIVTPPPQFTFAKFCMNCGDEINQDAIKLATCCVGGR
ncbi:hypothetical protein R7127_23095 [Vibrio sp. 1159]|uniref:hypothetical protein n=1 Tax=Vibrio sp. 1159 TaxID=3074545 RepID=UPI00296549F3|nr:hypothetical protein [Vibrio sp. 1159]MDW2323155.1 hypothetical protein [Vibrio sp. 1159]